MSGRETRGKYQGPEGSGESTVWRIEGVHRVGFMVEGAGGSISNKVLRSGERGVVGFKQNEVLGTRGEQGARKRRVIV